MNICRLCLGEGKELICATGERELLSKIENCASIEINLTDNLPKTICTSCIQRVNDWYNFRQMCIDSNEKLKKIEDRERCSRRLNTEDDTSVSSDCEDSEALNEVLISEKYRNDKEYLQNTYQCEICCKGFDAFVEYLDHQDEHNGQLVFNCDKCKEVFATRLELVEHEKRHKKPCPKCGKMILKTSMRLHLVQHTDRYVCANCSHRFSSKATLRQHIITVHTDIKDHVCEACGKRFSSKTGINVHLKTHKEERKYTCKLCNYAGRTSSAIYIHMATHSNEIHCCEVCPKTFKSARNLSDHLRRAHSKGKKHQCSYCDKKFVDKYMMMVHVRTHTGVRPYKCDLCDKAFIRSDSLKEHAATHGTRKFYDCERCMKKFTSKRGYGRHSCVVSAVT